MIKWILRKVFNVEVEESEYEGIRADEPVEVSSKWYDAYCDHKVIWEDIYKVYHLSLDGSEVSIKKLQDNYKMKDEGYSIYVRLRTPIFDKRDNTDIYHNFTLEEVKSFYSSVLENRDRKIKYELEKIEREKEIARKNETKNLAATVNKVMNKK